jgi:adenine-specific DNA-methyltransferase
VRADAVEFCQSMPGTDLAYLDPPYNQHRYFSNYHVWETLVRWDKPAAYGVARKREDARSEANHSLFNSKRTMAQALERMLSTVRAETVVVSYNNESWVTAADIEQWLLQAGKDEVLTIDVDYKRYVGAQIGIHNPAGEKVGKVSHLRNVEHVIVAGSAEKIAGVRELADSQTRH